jgi:hypothetical protein
MVRDGGASGLQRGAPAARVWRRRAAALHRTSRDNAFPGSVSDRDGEVEGNVGNRSRAFGGSEIGRGGGATASGGSGAPASSCGHGEAAGREKRAGEGSHHHVVLRGRSFDGERLWSDGAATAQGGNGGGSFELGFAAEAATAAWGKES